MEYCNKCENDVKSINSNEIKIKFIKGEMKELVKNIESYCIKKLTKQTRYCRLYDT